MGTKLTQLDLMDAYLDALAEMPVNENSTNFEEMDVFENATYPTRKPYRKKVTNKQKNKVV